MIDRDASLCESTERPDMGEPTRPATSQRQPDSPSRQDSSKALDIVVAIPSDVHVVLDGALIEPPAGVAGQLRSVSVEQDERLERTGEAMGIGEDLALCGIGARVCVEIGDQQYAIGLA
jgi:hypothetical protein